MKINWKLQDAKAKFSELVQKALKHGPQFVTRHGKNAVVVLSTDDYNELVQEKPSLKEFLLDCPRLDHELELHRDKHPSRKVDL